MSRDLRDRGYSLVELLVVIVILGVLAAIAVPAMLGQRRSAVEATVKADLHAVAVAVTGLRADPEAPALSVGALDVQLSPGNTVEVLDLGDDFCLRGHHAGSLAGRPWVWTRDGVEVDDGTSCAGTPDLVVTP